MAWVPVAFAIGGLSLGLAAWGWWRDRWIEPLFVALYLLSLGCVAAGPLTSVDIYPAVGVLGLIVLSVGACVLTRLRELLDRLDARGDESP